MLVYADNCIGSVSCFIICFNFHAHLCPFIVNSSFIVCVLPSGCMFVSRCLSVCCSSDTLHSHMRLHLTCPSSCRQCLCISSPSSLLCLSVCCVCVGVMSLGKFPVFPLTSPVSCFDFFVAFQLELCFCLYFVLPLLSSCFSPGESILVFPGIDVFGV